MARLIWPWPLILCVSGMINITSSGIFLPMISLVWSSTLDIESQWESNTVERGTCVLSLKLYMQTIYSFVESILPLDPWPLYLKINKGHLQYLEGTNMPGALMSAVISKLRNFKILIRKHLISTCDLYYNDQPVGAKGSSGLFWSKHVHCLSSPL